MAGRAQGSTNSMVSARPFDNNTISSSGFGGGIVMQINLLQSPEAKPGAHIPFVFSQTARWCGHRRSVGSCLLPLYEANTVEARPIITSCRIYGPSADL